jgi:hypothetical protein
MGEKRNEYTLLVGKFKKKGAHLENLGEEERMILKWFLKQQNGRAWTGLIWLRIGVSGGGALL